MSIRRVLSSCGLLIGLWGCGVPGHTYPPAEANRPLPVTFYAGHVVTVAPAAIGFTDGAIGIMGWPAFDLILGGTARAGRQPGGGKAGIGVLGIGIGPGVEQPAGGYEYTVAVEGYPPQILQIAQQILPEDCPNYQPGTVCPPIPPTAPIVIRVVGDSGRVLPRYAIPPHFQGLIAQGPLPLPLGGGSNRSRLAERLMTPGLFGACLSDSEASKQCKNVRFLGITGPIDR